MFHCNGWCTPWSLTAIAGTHVCLRQVRGDAIWQQLREHHVTHLNAAPTVVSSILNAPEAGPLTRPVLITTAGAPPSPRRSSCSGPARHLGASPDDTAGMVIAMPEQLAGRLNIASFRLLGAIVQEEAGDQRPDLLSAIKQD